MDWTHFPILSILVFSPLAMALIIWAYPAATDRWIRSTAIAGSLLPLGAAIGVWRAFTPRYAGLQMEEKSEWIPSIHAFYHLGVDGLSLAMVLLTSVLTLVVLIGASPRGNTSLKNFYGLILLEEFGLLGTFLALDFLHWFIFWEFSLIPMFFLIKGFGHERRTSASYLFFLYTLAGSVFLLLGFQFIYLATGSWNFAELRGMATTGLLTEHLQKQWNDFGLFACNFPLVIALFVMAGFAVKVPLWPFHSWLPPSYTQAPTEGSILLTALMSKMGVYGFLRIVLPLFHGTLIAAGVIKPLCWLAVLTILFGALSAFVQRDLKTLIAYSSVSHLGYCLFGIFTAVAAGQLADDRTFALNGVIVQMFAHGLSAAGLFYFAGWLERRSLALNPGFTSEQARAIAGYGGIRKTVPVFAGLMGITIFASLGLPGLCGFAGEFMIFKGSLSQAQGLWPMVAVAAIGLLLTAVYLLTLAQKIFFGPQDAKWNALGDLDERELWAVSAPLVALMFLIGLFPGFLVNLSNATVMDILRPLS